MEIKRLKLKNKKGYFFSLDAFIAVVLILGVIIFIKPTPREVIQEVDMQNDLLNVLSNLKIGEINDTYIQELITNGTIKNLNQSVLEQIGEFYANSDSRSTILTENILINLNINKNIGLYFDGNIIAEVGSVIFSDSEKVWTSRQIISGVDKSMNASNGFSSRAFLFSENKVDYVYFGGYVGDGNLSVSLGKNVISTKVEAVFSGPFNLTINNGAIISHFPTPNVPYKFSISNGFVSSENYLYFNSSNNLYIAGGFVKIGYNESEILESKKKFKFLGIEGFVNVYDSFYVPGDLEEIEVFLNFSSDYDLFLTIGNTTVYSGNGTNNEVTLSNATLASLLDFSSLNNENIPFRLGIENVSYVLNLKKDADVYSVTDLSKSMDCSATIPDPQWWCYYYQNLCEDDCGGVWEDPIMKAKESNEIFINAVLENEGDRVGLVGYSTNVDQANTHLLSNNNVSLIDEVNSWNAEGGTCICCGINEAVSRLQSESGSEKFQSMVIMSDGQATVECSEQGTGDPSTDAIQAGCDAVAQGITIYTVAFGDGADTITLGEIVCGNGNSYAGGVDDLVKIYEDIAQVILNAAYYEQTVIGEGFHTSLYPSSYISVDYEKNIPYGLIVTTESSEFEGSQGSFTIPENTTAYEAKVISYSGSKWTSNVDIYNNTTSSWDKVFNLSEYLIDFVELGDPYIINLPLNKLNIGENFVNVSIDVGNQNNLSVGSDYNKVIYSIIKNISSFSTIVSSASGCNWTIQFEDDTNSSILFPTDYSGTMNCSYNPSSPNDAIYNPNDAIDLAIFNLLSSLDLNSNGKVEIKFDENDLTINSIEVKGIPFVWETEAQVRIWQ